MRTNTIIWNLPNFISSRTSSRSKISFLFGAIVYRFSFVIFSRDAKLYSWMATKKLSSSRKFTIRLKWKENCEQGNEKKSTWDLHNWRLFIKTLRGIKRELWKFSLIICLIVWLPEGLFINDVLQCFGYYVCHLSTNELKLFPRVRNFCLIVK